MCEGKDFFLSFFFVNSPSLRVESAGFDLQQVSIFGGKGLKFFEAKCVGFIVCP
jgi:hypothetical protein